MNFRLFQTERTFRRQFKILSEGQKVLQMGRKHCGKRRNCSSQAISPFPTVFSKDLYWRHIKTRACWERIESPGFPLRMDESHCNRTHSALTADYCLDDICEWSSQLHVKNIV